MPSSLTPGSSHIACVQLRDADAAFAEIRAARHSQDSRNPFHAGPGFPGFTGSHLLLLQLSLRVGFALMPLPVTVLSYGLMDAPPQRPAEEMIKHDAGG